MGVLVLLISFSASVAGAVCGIGGGVIIKPALDAFQLADVATVSFLSGCTVLVMSCYSVGRALAAKESLVDFKTGTPLAIGAAAGGRAGQRAFLLPAGGGPPARAGGGVAVGVPGVHHPAHLPVHGLPGQGAHPQAAKRGCACWWGSCWGCSPAF